MSARRPFKQADASRALRAAIAAGLKPSGYTIGADGSISVQLGERSDVSPNSFDNLVEQQK